MPEKNSATLLTVFCPSCGKKRFTFSKNCIEGNKSIVFACEECGTNVLISTALDNEDKIYVREEY